MDTVFNSPLIGTVVKSCAGRDKKRVFIVIGTAEVSGDMRLVVTNGQLRPTDKPKMKNPRHVRPIGRLHEDEISSLKTADNSNIIALIKRFDELSD